MGLNGEGGYDYYANGDHEHRGERHFEECRELDEGETPEDVAAWLADQWGVDLVQIVDPDGESTWWSRPVD